MRTQTESKMRSTRIGQTKLKKCMKWTASGLLLAVMFALVFAGTLSGAFGIEDSLQQNGIIENNVASASSGIGSRIKVISSNTNSYTSSQSNIKLSTDGVEIAPKYNVSSDPNDKTLLSNFYYSSDVSNSLSVQWVSFKSWGRVYNKGFGYDDGNGSDKAYVYWLEFEFDDKIKAAIKTVGVSFYSSVVGNFDEGTNDEYAYAINYIGTHSAPTNSIVGSNRSGNNASWNNTFTEYADRTNWDDPNDDTTLTLGATSYSSQYKLPNSATGIRLIFAAISEGDLAGGFKNISCKLFLGNENIPVSISPYNAGSLSATSVSGFSNIEDTKTVSFSTSNDPYYFSNWQYTSQSGIVVSSNTNDSLAIKPYYCNITAQYKEIPFVFNGQVFDSNNPYNSSVHNLVVLAGKKDYMSSAIDGFTTSIVYKDSSGIDSSQTPITKGTYTVTITVKKGTTIRGIRKVTIEIIEGDFGKFDNASGKWGSLSNPYVIQNATHLKNLSGIVNGTQTELNSIVGSDGGAVTADHVVAVDNKFANCYFVISANIGSASAPVELVPIGRNASNYFAGTIYGGSLNNANARSQRTIYLNMRQGGVNNIGLFGYAIGANISYIKIAGSVFGGSYTGGVVGYADDVTISHVVNEAYVRGTSVVANNEISASGVFVGGIAGFTRGNASVSHCYNKGYISALTESGNYLSNSNFVGGIVGYARTEISYCANIYDSSLTFDSSDARSARIEGNDYLGGIAGNSSSMIKYCYDIQGQRKYRYDTGHIGAITGLGGTVENSWAVNELPVDTTASNPQAIVSTLGRKLVTAFTVTPIAIKGGETEVDWPSILSQDINGFKISTSVTSGNYLKLSDNKGTAVLPYKVSKGYTAQNSTSSTAITQGNISCDVYYNATTSNDIYAQVEQIGIDVASKVYNAYAQQVGGFALPTGNGALATFYFDRDINGNPTGTPTINKTNAGTYVVISDAKIKVGNATYVVGRKQANWAITPLYLRVSNATFNYGVNVEKRLQNNIVISATSGGTALTSHPFSVDIDSSAYNFYKSIPATSGQNTFAIASDKITIKNGDNIVTGNFVITGFEVVIKEGDFGVENSGINKNNINTNKWGSPNNPYIIRNVDQLARLSSIVRGTTNAVNSIRTGLYEYVTATGNTYSGAYFKLAASFSAGNITPIGTNTAVFSGTFDGNGNTIALSINVAGDYVGLFGYTSGATIQRLTISGSVKGSKYVGGVVGYALNTTIYKVTNNATVTARYSTDNDPGGSVIQFDGAFVKDSENFNQIFDNNTGTKFCGKNTSMSFVADLGSEKKVSGFSINNGDDTYVSDLNNRRPQTIYIWGSNSGERPNKNYSGNSNAGAQPGSTYGQYWTLLYSTTTGVPADNKDIRHEYAFNDNKTYSFRYFWIYVASAGGSIQFSEFDFLAGADNAGGVVGYAQNSSIEQVTNTAQIVGSSNVGGIAGEFNGSGKAVTNASNSGEINSGNTAAGIVGKLTAGNISKSNNSGKVTASVATTLSSSDGAFLGGIAGWASGNINNCYNTGEITTVTAFGSSNNVGGIAGYLVSGKTVSYCYNVGQVEGSSNVGGIIGCLPGEKTTVTFCYQDGNIHNLWDSSSASIGYITGNNNDVPDSCWILPSATVTLDSSITIKVNGRKLEVGANEYVPAKIDGSTYTPYLTNAGGWANIKEHNINGFRVERSVNPSNGEYFLSTKGSGNDKLTDYLTPSKVENSNPTNAENRNDKTTFNITAWYGANTNSDIYCTINTVTIDDSKNNIYNGQQQGFERSAVRNPNTNNSVYGVVFDYLLTSPSEHFVKTFAFDSNGNQIESGSNPHKAGAYNTTVFVKIGDVIVGKRVNRVFEIAQETINVAWEWTDGNQSTLFSRIGTSDGIQFVYNKAEQGLGSVTFAYNKNSFYTAAEYMFTASGNLKYTNASSNAYSRTYTLNDTRNFKIHSTNTNADLSGTTVTFEWIIRRNKLTIENRWVRADFGKDSTIYTFEYNAAHQGLLATDGITYIVENDTTGKSHEIYSWVLYIDNYANTINAGQYSRRFIVLDTTNYEIYYINSYVGNSDTKLSDNKGVSVNDAKSVATYSWQILAYNIFDNFNSDSSKTKVWFGGIARDNGLIVGNQLTSVISGTTRGGDSVNVDYYPLQSASSGVQQVLVYGQNTTEVQHYLPKNFIVYVQYNDGTIAQLGSNEYKLSNLVAPTAEDPTPINTSVTASGQNNFAGDLSKYYTVLYSDFGWKSDKNPNSANWGGSADNPYVIDRPEYLLRLSQIVNGRDKAWNSIANTAYCYAPQSTATAQDATYNGAYFLVTANIDMSAYVSKDGLTNFLPIGNSADRVFKATFDGGNNEIKYVYNIGYFINKANPSGEEKLDYVGLFGHTDDATIQNLTVKSERAVSVSVGDLTYKGGIHGRDYVGGIVGKAVKSTLKNIKFDYGDCVYGRDYVGGIVGFAQNTTIANPQNTTVANPQRMLNASVSGRFYVGGIAGEWQVFEKSQLGSNQQSLTPIDSSIVSGYKYVGGLVGWLDLSNCDGSVTFTPQYNNDTRPLVVSGTEYVGALFGTLIGNGYRQTANSTGLTSIVIESSKVGNVTLKPIPYSDGNSTYLPKVVGGLVGYIESAALVFGTGWNTSNVTFDFAKTLTSFLGGVIGVMGKNSTIEMLVVYTSNSQQPLTLADGKIVNNTTFGHAGEPKTNNYKAGSFVGGIVGYVSSQAGSFWREGTTIFGNAVQLENTANIYATGFAGGIFGALGNIALDKINQSVGAVYNEIAVEKNQNQENRTNILQKILVGGVREGSSVTTLGIAPTTDSDYLKKADGKLRNTASVHVLKANGKGGEYVGGIVGYSGANVRLVLRNKPQTGDIDVSALNVYSGGAKVSFAGSYAGGIAGFTDNLEHVLQYIVVQAKFTDSNAKRVGGLIGEMMSGSIDDCVVVSAMDSGENISYETDNFQGTEYVGGLVGRTENASIRNSVATGFNLTSTSITKGGVLGGGTNPTIEASWTFYIANEGATFSTVSANEYGKYILVDKNTITSNGSSYPSFVKLCAFAGIANTATQGAVGVLEFVLNVPSATYNANWGGAQLAFYDASGSDKITTNFGATENNSVGAIKDFVNVNNVVTVKLDMETGTSMQVCIVPIEFVNVKKWTSSNDLYASTNSRKWQLNIENSYKRPSSSSRYVVYVTNNNEGTLSSNKVRLYDDDGNVRYIQANVFYNWQDKDGNEFYVLIGNGDNSNFVGSYDKELTPGSKENPLTISNQAEWNDFAYSIYSGANDYAGKYVKLLTSKIVIDNSAHFGTASGTDPLVFSTECTPNAFDSDNKNAKSNLGYNFAGNITQGSSAVEQIYFGTSTTLSAKTPSFKGHFDGNGHTIKISVNDPDAETLTTNYNHRISVFPNASNATFSNLTIEGVIVAGDSTAISNGDDKDWTYNSAYDIAAFVGKPFGAITFENCTAKVNIQGLRLVAGFAGYSTPDAPITLIGCVNKGNITSYQHSIWTVGTGGKAGYPKDLDYGTGGLIAYATNDIIIESCLNTGNITGETKVGGLVGRVTAKTTINNSANMGNVTAKELNPHYSDDRRKPTNAWGRAGGLVGEASQTSTLKMYACYNTGEIRSYSNVVGGLVGVVGTIPDDKKTHEAVANNVSTIAYCYNKGNVIAGYQQFLGGVHPGTSGINFNGTSAGGLVGVAVQLEINYCYNTGDVTTYGLSAQGFSYAATYQVRMGGILGEAATGFNNDERSGVYVSINDCYTIGTLNIRESNSTSDTRYGANFIGYMQSRNSKVTCNDHCFGIANSISSYKSGSVVYYSGWNNASGGDSDYMRAGITLNSRSDLTAIMRSDGTIKPKAYSGTNEQTLWNASIATIGAQDSTNNNIQNAYNNGTLGGYVYVYGCLPQLAVFAVDTYNGLSMNSKNFGKDKTYGEDGTYTAQAAGEKLSPYVIRDGIDLMGVQTLVGLGYSFDGEYIEFANGKNNITLDQNLNSDVAQSIDLPISNSTDTKIDAANGTAYKAKGKTGGYTQTGKSYHLFAKGAVCSDDNNNGANQAYKYWVGNNHYYNGAYGERDGKYIASATFKIQNLLTIGRNGNLFKGSISGKQYVDKDTIISTTINNLRVSTGKATVGAYAGLFGHAHDAYIGFIEIGGDSNIWAYSSDGKQIAATGAIAGYATGNTVIEHCAVSGTAAIGAYGKNDVEKLETDNVTFAGGIVGLADTKQGNSYNAGITLTIKDCIVNIGTTSESDDRSGFAGKIVATKNNIGGVLGYVEGSSDAEGKGNSVRIDNCTVQNAIIQAAGSATTSGYIGGVLGFGSQYVSAFVTNCKVGVDGNVTIAGEHSLGGIAGGMSKAQGGYIDSCTVGGGTSITRIDQGGDNQVAESADHGTAIGGLVGFTQNSTDTVSPLTTTFSGTSSFAGTITVGVAATNQSADSDAAISQIGGIVGDMGSGANFASGSVVTVGGTISIPLEAANVGGVAGRTNTATFIGKFDVSPTMSTANTENVGGFIGKNIGTVYILADNTDKIVDGKLKGTQIEIGGTIVGTNEVGGFIGVNNSGSSLNIGSNVAYAKPYMSGTLNITITATVTGSGNNVGGIVGKNEGSSGATDYAIIDIVKGVILQQGNIQGNNYVGGIIGLNQGLLTTGGGEADTKINGATLSEENRNLIKNLSITNEGKVKGGASNGTIYENGDYVGGVIGLLDSPSDEGKGAIAGTFTNKGTVEGGRFVGGSIGFVGKNVTITAKGTDTLFVNKGSVTAHGYFAGGSIGALVGTIEGTIESTDEGTKEYSVNFENSGNVDATGFVGGSIGVLAGPVKLAQFVNKSNGLTVKAVNSVGGSVGYIGIPTPFKTELGKLKITIPDDYVQIVNTHFEAKGNLSIKEDVTDEVIKAVKDAASDKSTGWGGFGGAIGVIGASVAKWGSSDTERNTYYANGNVVASGINNVGGIVGLVKADNITISNMLAYDTKVTGGENVGGIVGATTGTGTVIKSAYAVEGTFEGSENVGGIIGLSADDTDAKSSYWVKGYSNAVLAGADVKDLQRTLGQFETIVEQVTVEGKQQSIVFTDDFCKLYTPKTYYVDYTGTHTYNGETVTLGENVELTWEAYFKDRLRETNAQIKNGAWVKPVANPVTFTTGTENTGWYFVYANDATGANGLGTINTSHSTNSDLQYWKRIADAYTASERQTIIKDEYTLATIPLESDIVKDKDINGADTKSPQKSTLYATATSAGENSGYYLYMATSGNSRPSATYSKNDKYERFFIKTLTASEDSLAQNVAVYYRTISRGKSLTYNGYERFAPVAITASADVAVPFIAKPSKDATKADSYCYSSAMGKTQIKPNTTDPYKSKVEIYYFDSAGTPHVVGGVEIDWEIKKRDLEASFSTSGERVYGNDRTESGDGTAKHDITLKISNIAPNGGANPALTITVKDKNNNSTVFTFNGTSMTPTTNNGITIVGAGITNVCENKWDASDSLYNVTEPSEKQTYEFSCAIDFQNAKEYTVEISLPNTSAELYNITGDTTKGFNVKPAILTISGNGTDSVTFDNKTHDYGWKVEGLVEKYDDKIAVLAAFSPKACAKINGETNPYEVALYSSSTALKTGNIALDKLTGVSLKVNENPPSIDLTGAKKAGEYYLTFATLTAGNYTLNLVGGTASANQSKKLAISDNGIEFIWTKTNDGSHTYDKKTTGEITLTMKTTKGGIENFGDFVKNYFALSMVGGTVGDIVVVNNSLATVKFTTGTNAKSYYVATVKLNTKENNVFIENNKHNCSYPVGLEKGGEITARYEIKKRVLTFTIDAKDGEYNGLPQGWKGIKVNASNSTAGGLIQDDSVSASVAIYRNNSQTVFTSNSNVSVGSSSNATGSLTTISWGDYEAIVSLNNSTNYQANPATKTWKISKHKLTLSGLQGGSKVYDGTAITPKLTVSGGDMSDAGAITWGADKIAVEFSIVDGENKLHESLVNAGTYSITIGGNGGGISVIPQKREDINTTENYEIDSSQSGSTTYIIEPRKIKLSWESKKEPFIFNNEAQGLKINGVVSASKGGNGQLAVSSSSITEAKIKGYAGNDIIVITVSGAVTDVANSKNSVMTAKISNVTGTNADGSNSSLKNYEIDSGNKSGKFEITPSVVSIDFTAMTATLEKTYDGNDRVTAQIPDSYFTLSATGHVPTKFPFTISGTYDDENVLYDLKNNVIGGKAVTFSYTFTDSSGNYVAGTVDTKAYEDDATATVGAKAYNVGKITPKHIQVFLDKLRSNKATRTYTDGTTYGGDGVKGNGTTKPYRAGEGFRVSGVLTVDEDKVIISANYAESDNLRNTTDANVGFDFSKYVNDVYKASDGTFTKATSGTYLKKLVFEMKGTKADNYTFKNYTFNVYHSSDGAYSESDGNFATKVTVYDSREKDKNRQNKGNSPQIQIEITVKSVKVEYKNVAQSYANDDNTYNTKWEPVKGTNKETDNAGANIIVTNGWMYPDGIDHSNESGYKKREYHGYTVIQGRAGSSRLGASVSTKDGMNLNYRLSNQPILTIAYFVSNESNEYKITSLARLLIASFYYTAHQNPQNLDMIKIVSSDYDWVKVVSVGEDGAYVGKYKKPDNSPIKDSKATTWDEYLAELQAAGYAVFFNTEKKEQGELGEWGYYSPKESSTYAIPTKFVQTKDIMGTFTAQDIEILNAFFTTLSTDDNGAVTATHYNWNGTNKQYLTNVLKARVGTNVTIDGSLFASTKVGENGVLTGFDGTYDGNGYVIEYLNIMGYGKTNVGLFDVIGETGIVKNVHLRNVTINAKQGNVGMLAGRVYESKTSIKNVSVHGAINASGGTVGGLFGTSARDIENAIVLGTITSQNATVGGVVGTTSASVKKVVSLVQITANGGSVNPFTTSSATIENSYHMTNAVWQRQKDENPFVNVSGKSKTFNELMSGSVTGYGTQNKYYYTGETAPTKGTFDVLDDVQLTALSAIGTQAEANTRQSMRLRDIVSVYLMMYSLSKTTGTLTTSENNTFNTSFNVNVYALSSSSWLVGSADGTQSKPIAIANKQNVSLLRQLPFATFTLKANISIDITSTFAGAFFGIVTSETDSADNSLGYKITCDKAMFEAYAESNPSWIEVA